MRPALALFATTFLIAPAVALTDPSPPPDIGVACDAAAHMPKEQSAANPDHGLDPASGERLADMLQAVVKACGAAAEAAPQEGRFHHRLGLALARLKRPGEAAAAFQRAMAAGYAGGYDEISSARFTGELAPAIPKMFEIGVDVATAGIAKTDDPEIKRDLGVQFLDAGPMRDRARARKLLEEAAAQHHPPAMVYLAAMLIQDGGVGNIQRARQLLDESIAAGSRLARCYLADQLRKGTALGQDPAKARDLYTQAVAQNHRPSMVALAEMLRDGDGGPTDVEGARRLLAKASGLGDTKAKRILANSLLHDDPKQQGDGVTLLISAAEGGSVEATYHLGDIYKDGIDVPRDSAKSIAWFRKAAEAGSARAHERIGSMYDYGEGVAIDHPEARRWYDKAVNLGDLSAYTDIGMQYDHAMGVPRDLEQALVFYRKGAEAGVASSMSNLGYAYEAGRGIKRDYAEAIKWYQKAVDLDDPAAAHNLANMYLDGTGVKKDRLRGLTLMRRAADRHQPTALNDLALLEHDRPGGSGHRATNLLREAVALDCKEAYLNLGQALKEGWDGPPDYVGANLWFQKAVDNPSDLNPGVLAEAQYQLASNLIRGRGIARDPARAMSLMRQAASGGNKNARAFMASAGQGGFEHRGFEHGRGRRR